MILVFAEGFYLPLSLSGKLDNQVIIFGSCEATYLILKCSVFGSLQFTDLVMCWMITILKSNELEVHFAWITLNFITAHLCGQLL